MGEVTGRDTDVGMDVGADVGEADIDIGTEVDPIPGTDVDVGAGTDG